MKEWMVLTAEIIILATSFLLLCYTIVWMLANQDKVAKWHIHCPKDPRWTNKAKIVNFIFIAFTAFATIIVAIIGMVTTK